MVFILLIEGLLTNSQVSSAIWLDADIKGAMHEIGAVSIDRQPHKSPTLFTNLYGIVSSYILVDIAHRQLWIGTLQPKSIVREWYLQDGVIHLSHTSKVWQQTVVDGTDGGIMSVDTHCFQHSSHVVCQSFTIAIATLADVFGWSRLLSANTQENGYIAGGLFQTLI